MKGRLALAGLISEALDALRAGHISLDAAKALTLARDGKEQLSTLTAARAGHWTAGHMRHALNREKVRNDNRKVRFIGTELYQAEGGTIDADLFEDQTYLRDSALVDRIFAEKLEAEAEALRAKLGWQWVKSTTEEWAPQEMSKGLIPIHRTPVKLPEADGVECDALEERRWRENFSTVEEDRLAELQQRRRGDYTDKDCETGGIIVKVNSNGKLVIDEACRKKTGSSNDSGSTTSATPSTKPALTQAGAEDLRRISLMALQGAMIDKTEFLLDLFAWQIDRGAPSYSSPFAITLTDQAIASDGEEGWRIDARLADPYHKEQDYNEDTAATFAAFQALGKKHRNQVLARGLTRALQRPGGGMAPLGRVMVDYAGASIRKVWTPDAPTYFSRLSVSAMEDIWAELLELGNDGDRLAKFAKLRKGEKAKELAALFSDASVQEAHGLSRDQVAAIDAWLPSELRATEE